MPSNRKRAREHADGVAGEHAGTDRELVARIAAGDADALQVAYDANGPLVLSVAYGVLGDRQLAEECTQDVFLTLWNQASTFDPDRAKLTTWLYTVTRNRAVSLARARRARPAIPVADVPDVPQDDAGDERDDALSVVEALAELPEAQRTVITLAYYGGLSHHEIAERLDLPLGTVKGRTRLALDRLRHSLGSLRPESGGRE